MASETDKHDLLIFYLMDIRKGKETYVTILSQETDVVPTSDRIIQDVKHIVDMIHKIVANKGVYVPFLASCTGHCHCKNKNMTK